MKYKAKYYKKNRRSVQWDNLIFLVLIIIMIIGFSLIAISCWKTSHSEKVINNELQAFNDLISIQVTEPEHQEIEETTPIQYEELFMAMQEYNADIFQNGQDKLVDAWSYQAEVFDLKSYGYDLDSVGIVTIPAIEVEMPLYLGASYDNLAKGFAQLSQTSMPTGGNNTNCVIAGHRGWNGLPYMRDVDKLEIGDSIYVQNPWEILEFRISEIHLIDPWEIDCVYIQPDRELLTLITCHPYGVGSHRYILICERYFEEETAVPLPTNSY